MLVSRRQLSHGARGRHDSPVLRYPPRIPAADNPKPASPAPSSSILSNKRFLEINDAAPSAPAVSTEPLPAPAQNQQVPLVERRATPTRSKSLPYNDQRFLEINGVYPESSAPPIATESPSPVSIAVVDLEQALDNRNSAHPMAQQHYQPQADIARNNLEEAIRDEIDQIAPQPPHFNAVTFQQHIETGQAIAARYSHIAVTNIELQRAVSNVLVDIEVEDALDYANAASTADEGFDHLNDRFDTLSETAQQRLLQEADVINILDDVILTTTAPLREPEPHLPAHLRVESTVSQLEALVNRTNYPTLSQK